MGLLDFWGTVPRLVPKFLRFLGDAQHFVPIHFRPTSPLESDPYGGIRQGMKPRTELEADLDRVQACLVADLERVVEALCAVETRKNATRNRKTVPPTLDDALTSVGLGPSAIETLATKGRRLIREREANCDPAYIGYQIPAIAARLAAIDDPVPLDGLKNDHVRAIQLVGRARNAAQATAKGFRATLIEIAKGKRRSDETISRDMLDRLPNLSIMEMTELSFVSGVNASHIWQCYIGAPTTIDYQRVFDLAVFAGRLSRGEPATITWDLARYILAHQTDPAIGRWWRTLFFPNTIMVHDAVKWICVRIDQSYGLAAFTGSLILCDRPGEFRTLRLPPRTA